MKLIQLIKAVANRLVEFDELETTLRRIDEYKDEVSDKLDELECDIENARESLGSLECELADVFHILDRETEDENLPF